MCALGAATALHVAVRACVHIRGILLICLTLRREFCCGNSANRIATIVFVCAAEQTEVHLMHRSIGLRSCSPMRDARVYVRQLQRVHCAPVRACACVCETHTGEDPTAIGRGMYNKFSAGVAVGATLKEVFGFCVRRARATVPSQGREHFGVHTHAHTHTKMLRVASDCRHPNRVCVRGIDWEFQSARVLLRNFP